MFGRERTPTPTPTTWTRSNPASARNWGHNSHLTNLKCKVHVLPRGDRPGRRRVNAVTALHTWDQRCTPTGLMRKQFFSAVCNTLHSEVKPRVRCQSGIEPGLRAGEPLRAAALPPPAASHRSGAGSPPGLRPRRLSRRGTRRDGASGGAASPPPPRAETKFKSPRTRPASAPVSAGGRRPGEAASTGREDAEAPAPARPTPARPFRERRRWGGPGNTDVQLGDRGARPPARQLPGTRPPGSRPAPPPRPPPRDPRPRPSADARPRRHLPPTARFRWPREGRAAPQEGGRAGEPGPPKPLTSPHLAAALFAGRAARRRLPPVNGDRWGRQTPLAPAPSPPPPASRPLFSKLFCLVVWPVTRHREPSWLASAWRWRGAPPTTA